MSRIEWVVCWLCAALIAFGSFNHALQEEFTEGSGDTDRLGKFYARIAQSDALYCKDRTRLLPKCTDCIPGLESSPGSTTCDSFVSSSQAIRSEIRKLVLDRFGNSLPSNRTYGLYPYLEKPEFLHRQVLFGKMLSSKAITNLIDIGAYYNPIHLFLGADVCPENVVVIEPILDPLSVSLPCGADKRTHITFLPITFRYYMTIKASLPRIDTVVCIGCDSHYGPSRNMLETSFTRPYSLYIEYPHDYVHNAPYRKMIGNGPGERLLYSTRFQAKTNATVYTKRVMKVIEYREDA